jgi:hypothetical protein
MLVTLAGCGSQKDAVMPEVTGNKDLKSGYVMDDQLRTHRDALGEGAGPVATGPAIELF